MNLKFGLTQQFPCSYLPQQQEQLLVFVDEQDAAEQHYDVLINAGFRRSGDQIYRPHCQTCNACQSIRIPAKEFKPSKSQNRILKRNADIKTRITTSDTPEYYALYERYINERHSDGTMYPASKGQYRSFIDCQWASPLFIEFKLDDQLIGVAVTDELSNALSAMYTFFEPDVEQRSIGTYAILKQIEICAERNKQFLYLGYQVDDCQKMNYKTRFSPYERFFDNKWHHFAKKPD